MTAQEPANDARPHRGGGLARPNAQPVDSHFPHPSPLSDGPGEKARCYGCARLLPVADFVADRSKATGRASICRPCDREKARHYYRANREAELAKANARNHAARDALPSKECRRCGIPVVARRRWYCEPCRAVVRASTNRKPRPSHTRMEIR